MASIKGKCTNLAGCSLAYTKQAVSVPDKGDFRCPECGQPLQPFDAEKPMKKPALAMILGGIGVLVAAAVIFLFLRPKLHPSPVEMASATGTPAATVAAETSSSPDANPSVAVQPAPSAPLSTPASSLTPAPAAQADAEAQTTPTAPAAPTPTPNASSAIAANSPAATPAASAADGNDESAQVKKQVLERIDVMPKLSASDRTKLYEAVDRARGMSKLAVVPFEPGRTAPAQAAVVQLGERLRSADAKRLLDDPTVIVVVLGYADAKGSEKSNLQISGDRAENLAKVLRDQVKVMNVLHSVGMGTSQLFSREQREKNRIAEVWAVLP